MSRQFYRAIIKDIQNDGCTDAEQEGLLDVFQRLMKRTSASLARKAYFELGDFHSGERNGLAGFTLLLEKRPSVRQTTSSECHYEQWVGTFEAEGKTLEVLGALEEG